MTAPIETIPGIYPKMSNDDYHAGTGVSKSGLDWIARCPAMYRAKYITREIVGKESPALAVGKAAHLAVFQPDIFDTEVAVAPDVDRRTKAGKEDYAAFQKESAGKTIISQTEHDQVRYIADAVHRHPIAAGMLRDGQAETSIFSTDQKTGELVKVRPDWMHQELLVDLKSILNASPDYFSRELWNRRYYVQAPFYLDVANQEYAGRFNNFLFICAEKEPPYLVEVYLIDQSSIQAGRDEYRRCLDLYHECRTSGKWPCYNGGKIREIGLPGWALNQIGGSSYVE